MNIVTQSCTHLFSRHVCTEPIITRRLDAADTAGEAGSQTFKIATGSMKLIQDTFSKPRLERRVPSTEGHTHIDSSGRARTRPGRAQGVFWGAILFRILTAPVCEHSADLGTFGLLFLSQTLGTGRAQSSWCERHCT